ncbi:MAG: tRNA (guanosine(46)-N7)-methyltransferase TrmB [Lachnospiraceae bacterium]|nr:tRNA (guanosine(46)-N7)-methyltransferase TrmB [Lachnospiraceae bacterium]
MRLRNVAGSKELITESRFVVSEPGQYKGKWNSYFKNANPIQIEIGMGKGQFITEMAKLNPEINYIGIEMYSSVLYRAVKKLERTTLDLHNLVLLRIDARDLTTVFAENEVSRIYLNFSDPWPKDRHAKRRITARGFLAIYNEVLKADGLIEFKTDNEKLFHFSLEEREAAGWNLDKISYDLHNDAEMMRGNVLTEYEEKFSALGNPIYKYIISR